MTGELAGAYTSGAQRARVVTEAWGGQNLFCPNCPSPKLTWLEPGHPASDYSCPRCGFWFQLKSQQRTHPRLHHRRRLRRDDEGHPE